MTLWEARKARDAALDRVATPRSSPWRALAYDALLALAEDQDRITSDDVWEELERHRVPRPDEGRAMGAVMLRAVRQGVIRPDGFDTGRDPRHHGDVMRVYRSCLR